MLIALDFFFKIIAADCILSIRFPPTRAQNNTIYRSLPEALGRKKKSALVSVDGQLQLAHYAMLGASLCRRQDNSWFATS